MKKLILLLFLLSSIINFAQEQTIFFGRIVDALGTLESVHILNKNTNQATSSDLNGEFKIFAKVKDSLKITFIGYKTKIIILQPVDFGISKKEIFLKKENIELDEIELKKHNLTGSLSSDIKNVKFKEEINAKTLKLPNAGKRKLTVAERRLYTAKGGMKSFQIGLNSMISVDYIINSLSGRLKKLNNLKKIEDNEKEITQLKNTFTNYIVQDLKIEPTDVSRFIYYCQEDKNYTIIKQKGELEVIEFLKHKALLFKELNKKE